MRRLREFELHEADVEATFVALLDHFESGSCFLLEAGPGPADDSGDHIIGIGTVVQASMTFDGQVSVEPTEHATSLAVTPPLHVQLSRDSPGALPRYIEGLTRADPHASVPVLAITAFDPPVRTQSAAYGRASPWRDWVVVPAFVLVWRNALGRIELDSVLVDGDAATEEAIVSCLRPVALPTPSEPGSAPVEWSLDEHQYSDMVRQALARIDSGDVYQVQLGHEVWVSRHEEPVEVYRRLRRRSPAPYMFYVDAPPFTLLGASPELQVSLSPEGEAIMRPLAGTASADLDVAAAEHALAHPKELAEHVMLVDLCRNDLGRVAAFGSVTVPQFREVQRYSGVFHLVSTITAQVSDEDCWTVHGATFPAGTVSGAPKISACAILSALEKTPRGLYSGSISFRDSDGSLRSAVIIRTVVATDSRFSVRASAGIVADSDPSSEWKETLNKMRTPISALTTADIGSGAVARRTEA